MEPQNLKQRPALNIITLPYLLQARVKSGELEPTAGVGQLIYWHVATCSICQEPYGYIFQNYMPEAAPRFNGGCGCASLGSRPATWADAAQHLLQHGTWEDFGWWGIEQPGATPFADSLQQQPAAKVLRFAPDPAIDRILIDVATGSATTITVVLSGQFLAYGPAVRQQTFGPELSSEQLMASVPDCLQWPAAPPEVVAWLQQPLPAPAAPGPADLTAPQDAELVAAARRKLQGAATPLNVIDVPVDIAHVTALHLRPPAGAVLPITHSQRVVQFARKHAGAPWVAMKIS